MALNCSALTVEPWEVGVLRAEDRPARVKRVVLTVNGREHALELPVRTTLAEALREDLGLTAPRSGATVPSAGAAR